MLLVVTFADGDSNVAKLAAVSAMFFLSLVLWSCGFNFVEGIDTVRHAKYDFDTLESGSAP